MSKQQTEHIERLLKSLNNDARSSAWRDRKTRQTAVEAPKPDTPDSSGDTTELTARLDEQTELLRAILASSIDTQEDARSTAQNSRTFAWAGTAIALLTLIATVIAVIAAVRAN